MPRDSGGPEILLMDHPTSTLHKVQKPEGIRSTIYVMGSNGIIDPDTHFASRSRGSVNLYLLKVHIFR